MKNEFQCKLTMRSHPVVSYQSAWDHTISYCYHTVSYMESHHIVLYPKDYISIYFFIIYYLYFKWTFAAWIVFR